MKGVREPLDRPERSVLGYALRTVRSRIARRLAVRSSMPESAVPRAHACSHLERRPTEVDA